MRNILTILFLIVFSSIIAYGQSSPSWTKNERNRIFENYLDYLTQYKNISEDQKESIALCALNGTTEKYNREEYQSKIEIELKRITESIIDQCAKNIGVTLNTVVSVEKVEEPKKSVAKSEYTKKDFDGIWSCELGQFTFYSVDSRYKLWQANRGKLVEGGWTLDTESNILNITGHFGLFAPDLSGNYIVESVEENKIILRRGSQIYALIRKK